MQESGLTKAFYVDPKIKIHNYAFPDASELTFQPDILHNFLQPIFSSDKKRISSYVRDKENHLHFVVALKSNSGLVWVLSSQPSVMKDLRKRIGIGGIIQSIGENEEIVYIVLQDYRGIISATKNITSISSIDSDPFISQSWASDSLLTRVTLFKDVDVFEVVKPLWVSGNRLGLIRTGMSMKAANDAMNRTLQRALAVLIGFVVIGVILFNLFINNQNYNLLTDAYSKIKTYTGNILENMADAVVVVDKNGKITLFNQAAEKLFNTPSPKAIGSQCSHIIGKQTSLLDETLQSGKEIRDKEVEYNLNSKTIVLSVTTRLIKNEKGAIDSAVAVLKDLTEKNLQ
jgi:PAS domain S-box-containing protein